MSSLNQCRICPRNCNANRTENQTGFCSVTSELKITRAALHFYEEPVISGTGGSGTVFFSGCNLKCIYCQNHAIALETKGLCITTKRLTEIFFELKEKGANNINLVTPTPFIPQIKEAILKAKSNGFDLPFVYNTSSYEEVNSLALLDGLIDIYLPDFKYMDSEKAEAYSHARDYPSVAKKAIDEMFRQVGTPVFDGKTGMMKRGVIVRHMLLPGGVKNAKAAIEYLYRTYGDQIYLSVMNQYTPMREFPDYPELSRRVTKREYDKIISYCLELGITNCFYQEGETAEESFIPPFNYEGVIK